MPVSFGRLPGAALALLVTLATPLLAQERGFLGFSTFTTNDAFGDGADRWQTSSLSTSFLYGPKGLVDPPSRFGALWELRTGMQIITPENTQTPAPGDRAVAGILRAELWTHAARGGWDMALGVGVEAVGPGTRVIAAQDRFHQRFGFDRIAPAARAGQIGTTIRPMASASIARSVHMSDAITLRPFAEARAGLETYGRVGVDVLIGPGFDQGVLARDYVTGHLYKTNKGGSPGVSAIFGVDVAGVVSSRYLPAPTRLRPRLRGGLLVEENNFSVFYGATWLGREFVGQPSGQLVGSLQFRLKF